MAESFGLSIEQRLRKSADFDRVFQKRKRSSDRLLLVYAAKNDLPHTRFGLSVSRKVGNSVRRSRIKRLLREAFRLSQHELPAGLDLVLIPRAGIEPNLQLYRKSLISLTQRLAKKVRQ